jgi:hypothetical protein
MLKLLAAVLVAFAISSPAAAGGGHPGGARWSSGRSRQDKQHATAGAQQRGQTNKLSGRRRRMSASALNCAR